MTPDPNKTALTATVISLVSLVFTGYQWWDGRTTEDVKQQVGSIQLTQDRVIDRAENAANVSFYRDGATWQVENRATDAITQAYVEYQDGTTDRALKLPVMPRCSRLSVAVPSGASASDSTKLYFKDTFGLGWERTQEGQLKMPELEGPGKVTFPKAPSKYEVSGAKPSTLPTCD